MKKFIGEGLLKIARYFRRSGTSLAKSVPSIVKGVEAVKGVKAASKLGRAAGILWRVFEFSSTAYFVYDMFHGDGDDSAEGQASEASPFMQMILSRPVLLAITTEYADKDGVADAFTSAAIAAQGLGNETGELLSIVRFAVADYILKAQGPGLCIYDRSEIESIFKQGISEDAADSDDISDGLKQILDAMDIDKLSDAELKPLDFVAHFLQYDNEITASNEPGKSLQTQAPE